MENKRSYRPPFNGDHCFCHPRSELADGSYKPVMHGMMFLFYKLCLIIAWFAYFQRNNIFIYFLLPHWDCLGISSSNGRYLVQLFISCGRLCLTCFHWGQLMLSLWLWNLLRCRSRSRGQESTDALTEGLRDDWDGSVLPVGWLGWFIPACGMTGMVHSWLRGDWDGSFLTEGWLGWFIPDWGVTGMCHPMLSDGLQLDAVH